MKTICPRCGAPAADGRAYCPRCGLPLSPEQAAWAGPLRAGTGVAERYVVERTLGQGGMGAVYRVRDLRLAGRPCALKELAVVPTSAAGREDALRRWHLEAEMLVRLSHPAVPQVYDRLVEGNRYYLVMEYVAGVDLGTLAADYLDLTGEPLPEPAVATWGAQVALVLCYLHRQDPPVVHRDVKPANILLLSDGRVKLVDFGLARPGASDAATRIGTPGYAPPEQYRGAAEPRSDVYGLGATLHHLSSGRDPSGQAPFDFPPLRALRPELGPALADAVDAMLRPEIAGRPPALEASRLLAVAQPEPAWAPAASPLLAALLNSHLSEATGNCPVCSTEQRPPGRTYCTGCGVRLVPPYPRRRLTAEPMDTGVEVPPDYWRTRRPERWDLLGPGALWRAAVLLGAAETGGLRLAFVTLCGERRVRAVVASGDENAAWRAPDDLELVRRAFTGAAPREWRLDGPGKGGGRP